MSASKLLATIKPEHTIEVIDTHTAGEPTRIVLNADELPALEGGTMLERHTCAIQRWDTVRRSLAHEPRGHSDMFGAFVLPPTRSECDAGVLFYDTSGFLTMCVHGVIGVSRILLSIGQTRLGRTLLLDTPAGVTEASVEFEGCSADAFITVRNVPSFLTKIDQYVTVNGREVVFDVAFGGNFTALVEVTRLGLQISPNRIWDLRLLGDSLLKEINRTLVVQHPTQAAIRGVTLAYFYEASEGFTQISNVVVFGNKQVDRSPCGTGTSALLAALVSRGRLTPWQKCTVRSVLGTQFIGHIGDHQNFREVEHPFPAFDSFISARSHITGINCLVFEHTDPFKNGFVL
jgi:proline racemase